MHKILISHEIPKALFSSDTIINDYPYVLAHLLWEGTEHYDEEYASFYKQRLGQSAYSILDNSCFELGSSIPGDVLVRLYNEYFPTHLVLPDVMGDVEQTLALTKQFLNDVKDIAGSERVKYMAVVQGKTYDEYVQCWDFYNTIEQIEVIGVNYRDLSDTTRWEFLCQMHLTNRISKKIHLLGCNNPIEFKSYLEVPFRDSIMSVDTSSPIIHGWQLTKYTENGIAFKPKGLLADNLDIELNAEQIACINHNVTLFKQFVNAQ